MESNKSFDVFVSYSSKNKDIADAIVTDFELNNIKCWYAPRDIMPGEEWVSAITGALQRCKVLVLIYTDESNESRQVMNEVAVAFNAGKTIVPFRLSENRMSSEFEYYLTRVHWLDAVTKSMGESITELRKYIQIILDGSKKVRHNSNVKFGAQSSESADTGKKKRIPAAVIGIVSAMVVLLLLIAVGTASLLFFLTGNGKRYMNKGLQAYYSEYQGEKDDETAREYFLKASKKGKADAYYYLGGLAERKFDYQTARTYYEMGVSEGSVLSELGLGSLYENGDGVISDLSVAKSYYDDALKKGCVEANYYEAGFLMKGYNGSDFDAAGAIDYYEKALKGDEQYILALTYIELGDIYSKGYDGAEKNIEKARNYYNKAIDVHPYFQGYGNQMIAKLYAGDDDTTESDKYYKDSLNFYKKSANEGSMSSNIWVGYCFQYGLGTEPDGEKAMDYYRAAADKDCPAGMYYVGKLYEKGYGNVKVDYDKAYEWYKKAADLNYNLAMCSIGNMYYKGIYGSKDDHPDYNLARQWFDDAIKNGYVSANYYLGLMYENGLGADRDYDMALEYFEKGAEFGDSYSMFEIGNMYFLGYATGKKDYDTAFEWYTKSAKLGNEFAMYDMGLIFEEKGDYKNAYKSYLMAAANNYDDAMTSIAFLYLDSLLTESPDYESALKWLNKAAELGNDTAIEKLGEMYYEGEGVEQDFSKTADYYEQLVEKGTATAFEYYVLGFLYEHALGRDKDINKGMEYLKTAADMGSSGACEELAGMYVKGDEVTQDFELAYYYYTKATEGNEGSAHAYLALGDMYYYEIGTAMNYSMAKQYYLRAIDLGYEDAQIYTNLGMICYLDNNFSKAADYYVKSLDFSNDTTNMYNAAVNYYNAEEWDEAFYWCKMTIENYADQADDARKIIASMVKLGKVTKEAASAYVNEEDLY